MVNKKYGEAEVDLQSEASAEPIRRVQAEGTIVLEDIPGFTAGRELELKCETFEDVIELQKAVNKAQETDQEEDWDEVKKWIKESD